MRDQAQVVPNGISVLNTLEDTVESQSLVGHGHGRRGRRCQGGTGLHHTVNLVKDIIGVKAYLLIRLGIALALGQIGYHDSGIFLLSMITI